MALSDFLGYLNPVNWFYEDPAKKAMPYFEQIPGQVSPYFQPYIQQGQQAGQTLSPIYQNLLQNPGAELNKIGGSFRQSPGFDFALQQALGAANRGFAAGGMAGSPMAAQQNMTIAEQLANQDYYNYLDRALGLYGKGLGGEEMMYGKGFGASQSMADMIAQALATEGSLQYAGTAGRNQMTGDLIKQLFSAGAGAMGGGGGAIGKIL